MFSTHSSRLWFLMSDGLAPFFITIYRAWGLLNDNALPIPLIKNVLMTDGNQNAHVRYMFTTQLVSLSQLMGSLEHLLYIKSHFAMPIVGIFYSITRCNANVYKGNLMVLQYSTAKSFIFLVGNVGNKVVQLITLHIEVSIQRNILILILGHSKIY